MNCPQCQTQNGPDASFCNKCGAQLTAASAPEGSAAPGGFGPQPGYGGPTGYPQAGGPAGYPPAGAQPPFPPPGQYQPGTSGGFTQRSLPPVNFDHTRLSTVDKIVAGATFVTMISIWLPWFAVTWGADSFERGGSASFSGTWGHGWLWLEFIVALVLLAYFAARAAWETLPFAMPVGHAPLLIGGTALQLLLILIAFFDIPYGGQGMGWDWGAFIGLLAALVAAGPVIYPAVKSYIDSRNAARA